MPAASLITKAKVIFTIYRRHRCEHVIFGTESRTGSAMVPLDRGLLSSYRQSIVTFPLSVTVWPQFAIQILTGISTPNSPLVVGRTEPLSNTVLLGTTWVSLPNGISSRPTILAKCTSVHECDRQTYRRTDHGNICRNRRNRWMNNDDDDDNDDDFRES